MSQFQPTADMTQISGWLTEQGLLRTSLDILLEGFCERLIRRGLPLMRGYIGGRTLHPTISVLACEWRRDVGIKTDTHAHWEEHSDIFLKSPVKRILDLDLPELRLRLSPDNPSEFPACEALREEGATDYLALRASFGRDGRTDGRTGVISSWATAKAEGFSDDDVDLLRYLTPYLALAVQARFSQDISITLLDTYVGSEAGTRILNGEIRRGALDVISAVILMADLRGFTAMSERTPRDELVAMLNQYFDCMVTPIVDRGGNILKFMGDGLLATFALNGHPADHLCEQALDAAVDALNRVSNLRPVRLADGKPVMDVDIALNLGDVFWGNVGGAERLDFTMIGPAVNETSRIETLCGQYQRNLLMSETFAKAATRSANRLVSIGRFAFRGVQSSQSIYTIDGL